MISAEVGSKVAFLYPQHGKRNVLCNQTGTVLNKGVGPNGPYLDVQRTDGSYRRLSVKKLVVL